MWIFGVKSYQNKRLHEQYTITSSKIVLLTNNSHHGTSKERRHPRIGSCGTQALCYLQAS
uniref:Uncharacterized protein n=1 Tax=Lepeophtheirus salmonis TaxID=72036 RepID=A0A0K2UBT9_LEPSM